MVDYTKQIVVQFLQIVGRPRLIGHTLLTLCMHVFMCIHAYISSSGSKESFQHNFHSISGKSESLKDKLRSILAPFAFKHCLHQWREKGVDVTTNIPLCARGTPWDKTSAFQMGRWSSHAKEYIYQAEAALHFFEFALLYLVSMTDH